MPLRDLRDWVGRIFSFAPPPLDERNLMPDDPNYGASPPSSGRNGHELTGRHGTGSVEPEEDRSMRRQERHKL